MPAETAIIERHPVPDSARIEAAPEGGGTPLRGLTHTDRLDRSEGFVEPILSRTKQATCELPECDRQRYQNKRFCGSHFMKWYRHGDPRWARPVSSIDLTGKRFGLLVAVARLDATHWRCDCDCGRSTKVRTWSLTSGGTRSCGDHRRLKVVGYSGAHDRVRRDLGEASQRLCVDCGNRAAQWSYRHDDPNELSSPEGPYSLNQEHYDARCVPCHKTFDLGRARNG